LCVPGAPHHCMMRVGRGYAGTRLELDRARPATAHPGCAHPSSWALGREPGSCQCLSPHAGERPLKHGIVPELHGARFPVVCGPGRSVPGRVLSLW
jgi:hypothetical protein